MRVSKRKQNPSHKLSDCNILSKRIIPMRMLYSFRLNSFSVVFDVFCESTKKYLVQVIRRVPFTIERKYLSPKTKFVLV